STSDAAREVSKSKRTDQAAICNRLAADIYGLEVLATDIEDHPENQTRFVLVGTGIPAPTGHDKTSIVCFQREDRPGSLLAILQEFAARAVNLTKLESRPTKRGLGDYCFFIDCEGHVADEVIADALRNLAAKQGDVKFLGSYPVGGPLEAGVERRRAAGRAWKHAATWVEGLRAQIREGDAGSISNDSGKTTSTGAVSSASACAKARSKVSSNSTRATANTCARSKRCARSRTRRPRRSGAPHPKRARKRSSPPAN